MLSRKNKIKRVILYTLYLVIIVVLFLEMFLRFYYPFPRSLTGNNWEMATNRTFTLHNDLNKRLDAVIINKRNSIGFRGEEPPVDIENRLSILTIGGSTTASTFISDGKTWTDLLGEKLKKQYPQVWINNAGIDGHSTHGHLNFLYYYVARLKFKPKIALFLIGVNDIDRDDLTVVDSSKYASRVFSAAWFRKNSKTVSFLYDVKWIIHPVHIYNDKRNWDFKDFKSIHLEKGYIDSALKKQDVILQRFRERLNKIVALCRQYKIQPVFITQPLVTGDGTVNGGGNPNIDLHVWNDTENGMLFWKKLQLYNDVTMQVADANKVFCIDLATQMPKDTLYFYDIMHYTNEGSAKVADVIYNALTPHLTKDGVNF